MMTQLMRNTERESYKQVVLATPTNGRDAWKDDKGLSLTSWRSLR